MIFSSLEYLLFLPLVVLLYRTLKGSWRLALVVASSLFFYMSWLPIYGVLLLILTTCTWILGRALSSVPSKGPQAKLLLFTGIALNLGCLCYYKYAGFILENAAKTMHLLRNFLGPAIPVWDVPVMEALLPLGISFFVFEFIHYLVDVYKKGHPIHSWMEFAAFASYFPSQIAGPIKRYQDFVQRLRAPEPLTVDRFHEAMGLIVQGLFKKVAIADPLGIAIYPIFASHTIVSATDAWLAATGFVIQVYCDFSGYTDIGRGSSLLMGIRLPENFRLPYLSADLTEFWRRWHMSLSEWLRDYVFIPLGGSRDGTLATWRNLMATMVACGLWHGASWHYVIFGFLQGFGLIVHRQWHAYCSGKLNSVTAPAKTSLRIPVHVASATSGFGNEREGAKTQTETTANVMANGKVNVKEKQSDLPPLPKSVGQWIEYVVGTCMTTLYMILTLVFFRASDVPHAFLIFRSMLNFGAPSELSLPLVKSGALVFLGTYFVFWILLEWRKSIAFNDQPGQQSDTVSLRDYLIPALRYAAWSAAVVLMLAATPNESVPFVYFQF